MTMESGGTTRQGDQLGEHHDDDAALLAELGYKQELHRRFSGFSNFAVSFSIISVLAGCITSYLIAMNAGGPVAISIGWPLVGFFVVCVALAMAEICSVYPTAGVSTSGPVASPRGASANGPGPSAGSTSSARSP